jgi:hypothetical protein
MKAGRRRSRSRPPPGAGSGRSPARPSGIDPSGRNDGAVLPVRILAASPSPERGGRQPGGWWPPAGLRRVCSFLTLSRSRREVLSRDNLLGFHIIDDVARGSTASNMRLLRGEARRGERPWPASEPAHRPAGAPRRSPPRRIPGQGDQPGHLPVSRRHQGSAARRRRRGARRRHSSHGAAAGASTATAARRLHRGWRSLRLS